MSDQKVRQSVQVKSGLFYGYIIVLATFCIALIAFGIRLTYGIFFNPMAAQFGWDSATVSSVFSLSILMEGTFGVIMGKLNDRFGPRLVLTLSGLFLGLGYFLMSHVNALWQMYLFYGVLVGIGMGGTVVPILTTISRWFVTRRAIMAGIVLAGTGIGALVLAPLVEWIIYNYDWNLAYFIVSIAVLVIVVLAAQFLKRDPAGMGLTPYLKSSSGERKNKPEAVNYTLKQVVRTRQFWLTLFISFIYGYIGYTVVVHLVPHIVSTGVSAAVAAGILAAFGVAGMPGRILLGGMADKIGNKQVYITCFILFSITFFALMVTRETWFFYLAAALFGMTSGGILSTQAAFAAELFGLKSHGEIFGVIGFANTIGGAAGPLLAGFIFDVTGAYFIAFLICALLGIAAFTFTALIKPLKARSISPG